MLAAAVPQPLAAGGASAGRLADGAAVTLVGPGRTDAQIAAQMYISVRTVSWHLDQIRDKTGCRPAPTPPVSPSAPAWSSSAWSDASLL
jgi:hypothetical protein